VNAALRKQLQEGQALLQRGELAAAIGVLQTVVAHAPGDLHARQALAMAHHRAGAFGPAVEEFQELHRRFPDDVATASNLAAILSEVGRHVQAFEVVTRALRLDPGNRGALCNLAEIVKRLGNWAAARDIFATLLAQAPDDPWLRLQHGMLLLGLGDWARGWPDYEARFGSNDNPIVMEPVDSPRLQPGEPLRGRRVVVLHEQGLGDSMMFSRLASRLAARGAAVHLRCPSALVPLLQQLPGLASCTAILSPMPAHDVHVPLMSMPHVLGLRPDVVTGGRYLTPPGSCPPHVAAALPPDARLTVALCWSGNPLHVNNRRRSIRTELLAPLRGLPGVRIAVMQKEPAAQRLLPADWYAEWVDLGAVCRDFGDSAHALARVDLVVTVDSAVAHLAGGLGRPTLLLLQDAADYRWELGTTRSRWYDSHTLIRQAQDFDWPAVVAQVREEILRRAALPRPPGGA
jgi:Flp pilus assembly protein TadD